jgi:hypothetical protein
MIANVGLAENYFLVTKEFTTTANVSKLAIDFDGVNNLDIYQIVGVDVKYDNWWRAAEAIQFQDRNLYQENTWGWTRGIDVHYRIDGLGGRRAGGVELTAVYLELYPTPDAAYSVRLHYIPAAQIIVADTAVVSYPNQWFNWIALDVAIQLLNKEESDPRALILERSRIEQEIKNQASSVDRGSVQRVRDTRRANKLEGDLWFPRGRH